MSTAKYVIVICDCDQVYIDDKQLAFTCSEEITDEDATRAHKRAKEKGWTFGPFGKGKNKLDLCPKHSKMYTDHQVEIDKRALDPIFSRLRATPPPSASELEVINE